MRADQGLVPRLLLCTGVFAACSVLAMVAFFLNVRWGLVLCLVIVANAVYLLRGVLLPLNVLRAHYARFNEGYDNQALFHSPYHFTSYQKRALEKLRRVVSSREQARLSSRQAQYLALQNQINPHFLYNTLEAIRGDALSEGLQTVANVTEALATFFRYTISNVDSLVPLEEELNNAENYFAIQKYRFGDRLSMEVEIGEGSDTVCAFLMPKLTLQPIIENAIIHGLEERVGNGRLVIRIDTDGETLNLQVADNGVGMHAETLDTLQRRLCGADSEPEKQSRGGIALLNVHNRIQLMFGEQYGVNVASVRGIGTQVNVSLPVQRTLIAVAA